MRSICTEKWINDTRQLLSTACVQVKQLFQEGNKVSHLQQGLCT